MESRKLFHEMVAEKLIEKLREGTAPWQKPWQPGESESFLPVNPTTGQRYRGINAILLMSQERGDQRWMTFKQAAALNARVRKGEKGTPVEYWKFTDEQTKVDADGQPVLDDAGKPVKQAVKLERPRVFFATVFNAEQIDGLPPLQPRKEQEWNPVKRVQDILLTSGAVVRHGERDRAFYRPATDSIHLPDTAQFPTADSYYATALHELGHWTGHESRLNRDLGHPFGSEGYAREELRAEIASMILGDELGIGHDPGQHAAYVGSWIKALEEDPLEIFRASADAEKIHDYVLHIEQKLIQEQQAEEQERILAELQKLHQAAYEDYSPLESWKNLQTVAQANGFSATMGRGGTGQYDPPYIVTYNDRTGQRTSISSELFQDGKAVTSVNGQRVPGTGLTSDLESQTAAFNEAVARRNNPTQVQEAKMNDTTLGDKTYIDVPYKEKEEAKALGAMWDRQEQSWYVPVGKDAAPFAKWMNAEGSEPRPAREVRKPDEQRMYLAVPYGERMAAKAAGAVWDTAAKSWYAGPKADMQKLERWAADRVPGQQVPAMTPQEEFAEALGSMGCVVDGNHPLLDGAKHRIAVEGDAKGEHGGFYVGHLDSHPAGYIKNNRTGIEMRWKAKGYVLTSEQKAQLQAEAATKLETRELEQAKLHEQTAQRVLKQMAELVPVTRPTPYLQAKGIQPQPGVMTDKDGRETCIPVIDADGKQWTMQYIQADGTKRFAKDSRKAGCFHAVGGLDALAEAPVLVIGEGYATAGTLAQTLGFATVAAFDSGNLLPVATALHEKFPEKPVVIAGDDDRHLEITLGVNPGRSKAKEAARAVGGKVLLPIFAPGEATYPDELAPFTLQGYRNHLNATKALEGTDNLTGQQTEELKRVQLTGDQLAALDRMKQHATFNDLATRSTLGSEGLLRQVNSIVTAEIEKHRKGIGHTVEELSSGRKAENFYGDAANKIDNITLTGYAKDGNLSARAELDRRYIEEARKDWEEWSTPSKSKDKAETVNSLQGVKEAILHHEKLHPTGQYDDFLNTVQSRIEELQVHTEEQPKEQRVKQPKQPRQAKARRGAKIGSGS
jgi:putative DNA primase/helicase